MNEQNPPTTQEVVLESLRTAYTMVNSQREHVDDNVNAAIDLALEAIAHVASIVKTP